MIRAKNRKAQKLLNYLCVDDFGEQVFRCWLTKRLVKLDDCRLVGPFITSVAGAYVCVKDSIAEEKASHAAFDAMDANCNTCKHLIRTPKTSLTDGMLNGRCSARVSLSVCFHPEDPMFMECWSPR